MKSKFTYFLLFLSVLLCVNCAEKDKKSTTPTTDTDVEQQSESTETKTIEELEAEKSKTPNHYICYTNDDQPSTQLSIAFNAEGNALFAKYKGQKDFIPLHNIKEDFQDDGAYPTITQFYDEMLNGTKNGTYELTHSGNWDYAVYRPLKKDTLFKFTIDHKITVVNGEYRKTPCF